MAQPYVGEIRIFAGNFAIAGWMFCEGQLLPISEYETLFNLIGTTYGGDGQSTFALPDLRGRVPIHFGNGFILAETGGVETVTLTVSQTPAHSHPYLCSTDTAGGVNPGWAFCDGQLLPLSQNTALFSLLGTTYGGDGKSNFALPDMQGNAPMHPGQGPGLSLHDLGETGGSETVSLLESEYPAHSHALMAQSNPGNVKLPSAAVTLARSGGPAD